MAPSPIDNYLRAFNRSLGLWWIERVLLVRELRDHMQDRLKELHADGLSQDEAMAEVLVDLGDPVELARTYTAMGGHGARRRWRRNAWLGGAMSLAVGVMSVWVYPSALFWRSTLSVAGPPPSTVVETQAQRTLHKEQSMRRSHMLAGTAAWLLGGAVIADSALAVPAAINHQGVVMVNGQRHTGTGYFKFAIYGGPSAGTFAWSNDGNNPPADANAVQLAVSDGIYSVQLGGAGMATLTPPALDVANPVLRIWFGDGPATIQQLNPDHPLSSVPYALRADLADTVADDAITTSKLASSAVTSTRLASDSASIDRVSGGLMGISNGQLRIGNQGISGAMLYVRNLGGLAEFRGEGYGNQSITVRNDAAWVNIGVANSTPGSPTYGMPYLWSSSNSFVVGNDGGGTLYIMGMSGGSVGIGTHTPAEKLHVVGNVKANQYLTGSSRTLKHDIQSLDADEAQSALVALQPVTYVFNDDPQRQSKVGFIAEDVPELVATADRQTLDPMEILAVVTKVVQEQKSEIEQLKARLRELERQQ